MAGGQGPAWPLEGPAVARPEGQPEALSPGAIAGLYRALRKGREDVKDEPGAADFYYGEMEMRRHDRGTDDANRWRGRASRIVLTAYWLVSGYGLRAWRSLVALAVVTALFAVAFHFVGFTRPPEPASYWTSLLYAFRSTVSLTDSQVTLTAWGSFFQALLRITGPVLLGLMLLALRTGETVIMAVTRQQSSRICQLPSPISWRGGQEQKRAVRFRSMLARLTSRSPYLASRRNA